MPTMTLTVEPATPESIAPFGELVGAIGPGTPSAFYESKVRMHGGLHFESDADTEITVASIDRREMSVRYLERHYKHTQTFIPLDGRPMVVIMAPPNSADLPDIDQLRAFLFDGSAGFTMKVGTWHEFPYALLDRTNVIVILRHETTRSLQSDAVLDGEAKGPDIDKKDILRRTGATIDAKLSATDRARVLSRRA